MVTTIAILTASVCISSFISAALIMTLRLLKDELIFLSSEELSSIGDGDGISPIKDLLTVGVRKGLNHIVPTPYHTENKSNIPVLKIQHSHSLPTLEYDCLCSISLAYVLKLVIFFNNLNPRQSCLSVGQTVAQRGLKYRLGVQSLQPFQPKKSAQMLIQNACMFYLRSVQKTPMKGWAVRSWDLISSGAFVCEYIGVLKQSIRYP